MSNLIDYWYWKNFVPKDEIKEINSFIEKNFDSYENFQEQAKDLDSQSKKTALVKVIKYKKIKPYLTDIVQSFILCNQRNFGYNLYDLNYSSNINLNVYSADNKGKYDWHTDGSNNDIHDIKLTALVNISIKKYEGGDFYIFNNNESKIDYFNEPGDMLLFKSNLHHKVTPVIKGERRTLTIFFEGPKFK